MSPETAPDIPAVEHAPRVYAFLASQTDDIKKLGGVVCGEETIGRISLLGEELRVPVRLFSCQLLQEFLDRDKESPTIYRDCRIGDIIYPLVPIAKRDAKIETLFRGQETPPKWTMRGIGEILQDLKDFSECAGGLEIQLHARPPSGFHEPFQHEGKVLHLFIQTLPSPAFEVHFPNKVFDIDVETPSGYYQHLKPVRGRGVALSDGKNDVVQIIGRNVYVLFDPFEVMEASIDTGLRVFRKMMVLTFEHLLSDKRTDSGEDDATMATKEDAESVLDAHAQKYVQSMENDIARQMNKLREKEAEVLELKRRLLESKRLHGVLMQNDFYGHPLREHLEIDYARIVAHPLVECVAVVPECGLDVTTKTICITHEGVRRRIGAYIIRLGFNGDLFIFTTKSYHPKSVPHPHISAWNGPCFGNIKMTIDDALLECRLGDAVEYLMEWLTDGYSPELVIHNKIEEWAIDETQEGEI